VATRFARVSSGCGALDATGFDFRARFGHCFCRHLTNRTMVNFFRVTELGALTCPVHSMLPPFDAATQCAAQRADAHAVVMRDEIIMGRCSLWWTTAPALPGETPGLIGHFAAVDEVAARELLAAAGEQLRRNGCTRAIGPMDGNTWRRYRLLTERGTEPIFFLELDNPDVWPNWFVAAGFSVLATYFSALNGDLSVEDPRIPNAVERLERGGVRIRPLNPEDFAGELRRIYAVSCVSFRENFLYTPISEAEFMAQHEAIRPHVRPELVLLAERDGEPVGFVFGIPDLAQARRGQVVNTVVLKTVAVLPGRAQAGLGNVLVARCQEAARALGFRRVIHALMHETNNSLNLSGHYAKPFRRYALFSRDLKGKA
jgi:predicted N-acetyltransferase YhbS